MLTELLTVFGILTQLLQLSHYLLLCHHKGCTNIVMSMFVCVRVCVGLRGYLRNRTCNLYQMFCACSYGLGSVLLRLYCNMLCTSSFVDDIMFCLLCTI